MPGSELLRDRERLATAVQEAGAIAKKFFRGPLKQWTKGQGDSPVTEADIASNDLLKERLVEPGDGVEDAPRDACPVVTRPSSRAVALSSSQVLSVPSSISAMRLPATPSPSNGRER